MGARFEIQQLPIVRVWQSLLDNMNRVVCSYRA
jgi:hypothetical protein